MFVIHVYRFLECKCIKIINLIILYPNIPFNMPNGTLDFTWSNFWNNDLIYMFWFVYIKYMHINKWYWFKRCVATVFYLDMFKKYFLPTSWIVFKIINIILFNYILRKYKSKVANIQDFTKIYLFQCRLLFNTVLRIRKSWRILQPISCKSK